MSSEANMILVVDDTPITARWVGYVAGCLGFGAVLAFNAEEALKCLAEETFAVVITDVEMPGMNGFELLQVIRLLYPNLPVILMSAHCDDARREAAQTLGAQGFLEKPVNRNQLAELFGGNPEELSNAPQSPVPMLAVL